MIWDDANQGRQGIAPDNHLARFVGRKYIRKDGAPLPGLRFLDIGPGKHGANQTFLEAFGWEVVSVDISAYARANIHADIRTIEFPFDLFDCIFDINTLCHVENMDYSRMRPWLKPDGRLFSVMPADGTWMGHLEGKGFVWCPTEAELSGLFDDWTGSRFGWAVYPDGDHAVMSWIIEVLK